MSEPISLLSPQRADKYSVLSLFSGAMGLDLGLERTGRFKLWGCVEACPVACRTILANRDAGLVGHPGMKLYDRDIRTLEPASVLADLDLRKGELDVLVAGPPCQSFSSAGRRRGVQDSRGRMLWEVIRFIRDMQPRAFLVENVRGLVTAAMRPRPASERPESGGPPLAEDEEPGSVIRAFVDALPLEYRVDIYSVNAASYGVAQNRQRIFIVGNRYNRVSCFPSPTHGEATGLQPVRTLRDALSGLAEDNPMILDFSERRKGYLTLIPPGSDWHALPEEIARLVVPKSRGGKTGFMRRLSWDEVAPTILCNPNQAATSLCHPAETRALTARECGRLQGFPDDWRFEGSRSAVYRQIGNAVPVLLAEVCGHMVAALLDTIHLRGRAEVVQARCHFG